MKFKLPDARCCIAVCLIIIGSGIVTTANAQLFPGLEGQELIEALQDAYTPEQLLSDAQLRDTLYASVFLREDTVKCIYSGYAKFLPEGVDPSQWLYGNGIETGSMNMEHGWPQAKGAGDGTMGNRDMHHLYPSRTAINSDRANFPFQDIPDPTTQKWYYLGMQQSTIPSGNINSFSEFKKGFFEPRESVKGDIARAMFYFWTIYREDAVDADPAFFDQQRSYLCSWHEGDPVDAFEMERTARIASYQDGKENPFILDCSLAKRTYCGELPSCEIVGISPLASQAPVIWFDYLDKEMTIVSARGELWEVAIYHLTGVPAARILMQSNHIEDLQALSAGVYLVAASFEDQACVRLIFLHE